jgi:hypothetical protein
LITLCWHFKPLVADTGGEKLEKITGTVMGCSVGYDKRWGSYGLRKGNNLKVDVVGENTKRRRLMVEALFIMKLVKTNSGETACDGCGSFNYEISEDQ